MNIDKSVDNLINVYRFRGLGDGSAHMDDDTKKLLTNYTAAFIGVALEERRYVDALRQKVQSLETEADSAEAKGEEDNAMKRQKANAVKEEYLRRVDRIVDLLKKCGSLVPDDWRPRVLLTEYLIGHDRYADAIPVAETGIQVEPTRQEYYLQLARAQEKLGKHEDAIKSYRGLTKINSDRYEAFAGIAGRYKELGRKDSAIAAYREWLEKHPGDKRAKQAIEELEKAEQPKTDSSVSS